MKAFRFSLCLAMAVPCLLLTSVSLHAQTSGRVRSATVATDINGFRIGMSVDEARSIAPLRYIGGDQFEVTKDGVDYNFGVTPRSRIYRVQSTQNLGDFEVDQSFIANLSSRLTSKYGPPIRRSGDELEWELIQPVTNAYGQTVPFRTMWMTAYIGGFELAKTLEMTIIDFRILWADGAAVNQVPRENAEDRVRF